MPSKIISRFGSMVELNQGNVGNTYKFWSLNGELLGDVM